jgi:hypothetical protein
VDRVVTIRVGAGLEGGGGVAGTTVSVLAIGGGGAGVAIRGATGGIDVDGAPDDGAPDDGAPDDGAADDGGADDRTAARGADGDGPDDGGAGVRWIDRATTSDTPIAASSTTINPHRTRLRRPTRVARCRQLDRGRQTIPGAGGASTARDGPASTWTTVA